MYMLPEPASRADFLSLPLCACLAISDFPADFSLLWCSFCLPISQALRYSAMTVAVMVVYM